MASWTLVGCGATGRVAGAGAISHALADRRAASLASENELFSAGILEVNDVSECADGTLYTGITTDVARRVAEHNGDSGLGARYTRSRRPVALVYVESADSRAQASRREAAIKRLDRARKLALSAASP